MPALADAPGIARVLFRQTLGGANVYNVLHVGRTDLGDTDPIPLLEVESIANDAHDAFATHFLPILVAGLVLEETTAQDLTSNTGLASTYSDPTPGTSGAASQPNSVACVISWHTSLRFRGGHARTYIAGAPADAALSSRHFTTTFTTALRGAALAFAAASPTGYQYVMLKRITNGAPLTVPVPHPLLAPTVNQRMDSQRRRLGRV